MGSFSESTDLKINEENHEHENEHEHEHAHHAHSHVHDPEEKKKQINRVSRIIGHLEHVKKMLVADEDCADVLVQISAVKSALNGLGKRLVNNIILKEQINSQKVQTIFINKRII